MVPSVACPNRMRPLPMPTLGTRNFAGASACRLRWSLRGRALASKPRLPAVSQWSNRPDRWKNRSRKGTGEKKKQVVADAINRLPYNTVLRCAKEDGVRPYFDVGVWSYGGNEEVKPAFGFDLLSIKEIADKPKRTEMRKRRIPDGAGSVYEEEFQLPVWFDPIANGKTPMSTLPSRRC